MKTQTLSKRRSITYHQIQAHERYNFETIDILVKRKRKGWEKEREKKKKSNYVGDMCDKREDIMSLVLEPISKFFLNIILSKASTALFYLVLVFRAISKSSL